MSEVRSRSTSGVAHEASRDPSRCGVFCDAEPAVSFEAFGYQFHWCRDCYEEPCSRCREEIKDDSNKPKGWCQSCREEIRLICGGDEERGVEKEPGEEQTKLLTDGGSPDARDDHSPPTNHYGEVRSREAVVSYDGHLSLALEHVEAAVDEAADRQHPATEADIHLTTKHLESLVEQPITSWQPNAPAEFVDDTIEEIWALFYEHELHPEVSYHLRSALQHLATLQRCPRCGRPLAAELIVDAVGTGGPTAVRGDPCVIPHNTTGGWAVYVHEGGDGR